MWPRGPETYLADRLLSPLRHLTSQRSLVAYAPNGERLYSTSVSGCLAVYDATVPTHTLVKVMRDAISGKPGVKALALESGGFRVAVIAASDNTVSVLDAVDLQEVSECGQKLSWSLQLSTPPNGCTSLFPIQVLCLDITVVASRSEPSNHAVSLCFTPDSSSLLVLTVRGALLKFSADTGALTSKVCVLPNV